MRRLVLLLCVVGAFGFLAAPPAIGASLKSQLVVAAEKEKREFDPVIGKAIAEKSGFFIAAVIASIVLSKLAHLAPPQ